MADDIYADENELERKEFCDAQALKPKCFSGLMTPNEAIEWWSREDSIDIGKRHDVMYRHAIIKFLMFDHNQSDVERTFSGLQRKATSLRPRLHPETILNEELLKTFKRQPGMFEIFEEKESKKDPNLRNELIYLSLISD